MDPRDRTGGGPRQPGVSLGLLGATSFVGRAVLAGAAADAVTAAGGPRWSIGRVVAFSRSAPAVAAGNAAGPACWHVLAAGGGARTGRAGASSDAPPPAVANIPLWITACPLWSVPEHLPLVARAGGRRLVALSSTSRLTKHASPAARERAVATRLADAEDTVLRLARERGIAVTLLRPTMIYDGIHDRNVARVAAFIRRFACYPLAGAASGLRQPVHAADVAAACLAAVQRDGLREHYELSGGETLTYRDMVRRIFAWLGRPERIVTVPGPACRAVAATVGGLPGLGPLAAMAVRMNEHLAFDHRAAAADFGFHPRPFELPSRTHPDHAA